MRVDEHTITLGQEPVFYRSASWTGVPALYLHGIPTSSEDWTAFLERTGGLAPDLPGFGRSAKGGHLDYTIEAHAGFVEGFLAGLEIDRVRLVAHDWGAGGGLVFAQRHPERIDRLVLCNALPLTQGFHWHGLPKLLRRPGLGELIMGSTQRWLLARVLRNASAGPVPGPTPRSRGSGSSSTRARSGRSCVLRGPRRSRSSRLPEPGSRR